MESVALGCYTEIHREFYKLCVECEKESVVLGGVALVFTQRFTE
ncbi:3-dehydroquinate dehydratase [Flavobacteria bacterium BAL38]|nr:3-dehydroquinate dehydratase [Flavobacteria bacterium BAL38]